MWAVAPENPLTARVTANRLWKLFFGYGIARSLEETGVQGEQPRHLRELERREPTGGADIYPEAPLHPA